MDDYETEEPEADYYLDERSRAVQRAMALTYVWQLARPGSIWEPRRIHRRPEWRPDVLH